MGLFAAIVAAAPAAPVAVKVTGLPDKVPELAVNVFEPAVALRVQLPTVAIPSAPVAIGVAGSTVPLFTPAANVTGTSATGFPFASLTITDGGEATAVPASAV